MISTNIILILIAIFAGIVAGLLLKLANYATSRIAGGESSFDHALILCKLFRKDFGALSDKGKLLLNRIGYYLGGAFSGLLVYILIRTSIAENALVFFIAHAILFIVFVNVTTLLTKVGLPIWKLTRNEVLKKVFNHVFLSVFTILAYIFTLRLVIALQ